MIFRDTISDPPADLETTPEDFAEFGEGSGVFIWAFISAVVISAIAFGFWILG